MHWTVTQAQLEKLKEAAKKNKDGLSNFILVENRDKEQWFTFRVVCEQIRDGNRKSYPPADFNKNEV